MTLACLVLVTARKRSLGQGNIFTPVCHSVHRGGMHGCSQGGGAVCGCSGGHAWLLPGGVRGCSWGHAWLLPGGVCGCFQGVCVVAPGGMHGCSRGVCVVPPGGGHAWDTTRYGDTINERAVRILLECILVLTFNGSLRNEEKKT